MSKKTSNRIQNAAVLNFGEEQQAAAALVNEFRRDKAVPKRAKVVAYTFNPNAQQGPAVGDTVAVRHRTSVDAKGHIKLVRDGIDERRVKRVYFGEDGGYSILDSAGEQWLVRPAALGGSKWETFGKGEGRKELQ